MSFDYEDEFGKVNFGFNKIKKNYEEFAKNVEGFDKKSKQEKQNIIDKAIVYHLPLLGAKYHAFKNMKITSNKEKTNVYKYFGLNWYDLCNNGELFKHIGHGTCKIKYGLLQDRDYAGIVLINLSKDDITVENIHNGDIYHIKGNEYSFYNELPKKSDNEIKAYRSQNKEKVYIQTVMAGYACYLLLCPEDIANRSNKITDNPLFNNIYLATGIINPEIYLNTISLNAILKRIDISENGEIEEDDTAYFQDFIMLLEEKWELTSYLLKHTSPIKQSKIPYKIHWLWLSKNPAPTTKVPPLSVTNFSKYMESWILRNPNCEYNLWTNGTEIEISDTIKNKIRIRGPEDIEDVIDKLRDHFDEKIVRDMTKIIFTHKNPGLRADTLRQVVLFVEGGLYCDVNDMLCLLSFEPILDVCEFLASNEPMNYVNNAIMGAKKNHIIPRNMIMYFSSNVKNVFNDYEEAVKTEDRDEIDSCVCGLTGPIALSSIIYGVLANSSAKVKSGIFIFPSKFLYSNYEIKHSPIYWITPVSYSAHFDSRSFLV